MGYNSPPGDEITQLFTTIDGIRRRVSELERPTGTQVYDALAELRQLVEDLPGEIDAALAIAVNTGTVTASGNISAGGTITSTGRGTFTGGVTSADVKTRVLSVGYDSVYIDANNIMGLSPSARRFKQDIEDAVLDASVVDGMRPRQFRLKGAIEAIGDDAPVELGFIAEELDDIGLGKFITRDGDGQIAGVAYERLCIPLLVAVKQLRSDVAEIRESINLHGGAA